jgi:hypothetical protein
MPLYKGEIAFTNRKRQAGTPTRPIIRLGLNDGSVIWQVERKVGEEVLISRRDIADKILALEKMDAT